MLEYCSAWLGLVQLYLFVDFCLYFITKMSKLDNVANKIKSGRSNATHSKTKFLPYHPAKPKTNTKTQPKRPANEKMASNEAANWQITWMNEYNTARQLLATNSKALNEKTNEVVLVKETCKSQAKLLAEFRSRLMKKKNTIIQQLVHCLTQKPKQCSEATTQTAQTDPNGAIRSAAEPAIDSVEDSTEIEPNDNEPAIASNEMPVVIETDDSPCETPLNIEPKLHCQFCNAPFFRSSSLKNHIAEFCAQSNAKAAKDMECKICFKKYTLRGLRVHFNNYTTGKHTARSAHANYSPEEHAIFKTAAMNKFEYP